MKKLTAAAAKTAMPAKATAEAPAPDSLQQLVVEEQRELRRFLCAHPCPSKGASPMGETGRCLRGALAECHGGLQDFDYWFGPPWTSGLP